MAAVAGKGEGAKGAGEGVNKPMWEMWRILRPTWKTAFSKESEVLVMVVVALGRALEVRLLTQVIRVLDGTLTSRNAALFRAGLLRLLAVSSAGITLTLINEYLRARITWKWKQKLLGLLHRKYFDGLRYYQVSEGGAYGKDRMGDADTRLTDDMNATVAGFAHAFANVVFSACAGISYSVDISRLYGWRMAAAPFAYVVLTFVMVNYIAPVSKTWRMLGRERGRTWGIYCHSQMKLIEKAESVAALRGRVREAKLFCEQSTAVRVACYNQHVAYWKFGIVNNFFQWFVMDQLAPIFVITRAIHANNAAGVRLESIDAMAEMRADAGVQWVLFTKCMGAARVMMNTIRVLQQLVGNVERVTELLALLDKVKADKASEAASHVHEGDCIAFEGVEIATPAGVRLVRDLSFRVERHESLLLVGHNGAGKSSIFRCLGSLWNISAGAHTSPCAHVSAYEHI
jgi:ATP-binding cassette subfamily D (ALD) protein 3